MHKYEFKAYCILQTEKRKAVFKRSSQSEDWLKGTVVFLGEGWFVSDSGCTKAYHKINKNIFEL